MTKQVGIGFIGTGFARKVQMPAFAACEGARLVSVASGNIENAQLAAKEFGIEHFTADWRETVANPDVDLVCITTPPSMHREMVLFAIKNGKHILCEKPMAMNVAEANEMAEAATRSGKLAIIDHELRFQPGRQKVRQMLIDGEIGKVRHVKTIFQAPHRGDPDLPWNWWSDERSGGGALGAINSHIIDSMHWFLGTEIESVSCQLQTHVKERRDANGESKKVTTDDEANMLLRFATSDLTPDATGLVSVSMTEGPRYAHRMEFYGEKGTVCVEHDGSLFIARHGEVDRTQVHVYQGETIPGVPDTGFARAFRSLAPKLIEALQSGSTILPEAATFTDGLAVQKVLDAARKSHAQGRSVTIREDL